MQLCDFSWTVKFSCKHEDFSIEKIFNVHSVHEDFSIVMNHVFLLREKKKAKENEDFALS